MSGSDGGAAIGTTDTQDPRNHSPNTSFAHRAIMGGAADFPERSSSPLKRPASELDQDSSTVQEEDVEMDALPSSNAPEGLLNTRSATKIKEHSERSPLPVGIQATSGATKGLVAGEGSELTNGGVSTMERTFIVLHKIINSS